VPGAGFHTDSVNLHNQPGADERGGPLLGISPVCAADTNLPLEAQVREALLQVLLV
jgi:hypothetical protein